MAALSRSWRMRARQSSKAAARDIGAAATSRTNPWAQSLCNSFAVSFTIRDFATAAFNSSGPAMSSTQNSSTTKVQKARMSTSSRMSSRSPRPPLEPLSRLVPVDVASMAALIQTSIASANSQLVICFIEDNISASVPVMCFVAWLVMWRARNQNKVATKPSSMPAAKGSTHMMKANFHVINPSATMERIGTGQSVHASCWVKPARIQTTQASMQIVAVDAAAFQAAPNQAPDVAFGKARSLRAYNKMGPTATSAETEKHGWCGKSNVQLAVPTAMAKNHVAQEACDEGCHALRTKWKATKPANVKKRRV
mmetsp:Transcript_119436/g.337968  ORF Transcript_119436/g.337968 Transcript_119436/m.337968 type:complete len:310 (+) Transcript_119436:530-1459(+)